MIAACYIRVSTEDQTEYSPEAQKHALTRYAEQHGMSIPEEYVYIDAGVSGRHAVTRPAFMAMISAARSNPSPFSVILIHKFDRFARNREDSIVYKSMLRRQCGVQVISITEHLEDDRMGLIMEAMLEAMAEYYSLNLGDEVRKGMTEKARRGELQTVPPFGYTVRENCLVPLPQEEAIVKEIFARFLSGASIASISRWARGTGILTHRGNLLDGRGIRYILSNPVYTGKLRWTPQKGSADSSVILSTARHMPFISCEDYEKTIQRLNSNRRLYGLHSRPSGERRHWLSGFVKCAACGKGMVFCKPHYLRCGGYIKGRCKHSQHISVACLERAILERIQEDGEGEEPINLEPAPKNLSVERKSLDHDLEVLEKRLQRLKEAYLSGIDSVEEYRKEKGKTLEHIDALRRKQAEFISVHQQSIAGLRSVTLRILDSQEASMEEKYRAAVKIIETCLWNKEEQTVSVFYRFSF